MPTNTLNQWGSKMLIKTSQNGKYVHIIARTDIIDDIKRRIANLQSISPTEVKTIMSVEIVHYLEDCGRELTFNEESRLVFKSWEFNYFWGEY